MNEYIEPNKIIDEMSNDEMIHNLHQIQHLLNGLINGEVYDGDELIKEKLYHYKLSVIKVEREHRTMLKTIPK